MCLKEPHPGNTTVRRPGPNNPMGYRNLQMDSSCLHVVFCSSKLTRQNVTTQLAWVHFQIQPGLPRDPTSGLSTSPLHPSGIRVVGNWGLLLNNLQHSEWSHSWSTSRQGTDHTDIAPSALLHLKHPPELTCSTYFVYCDSKKRDKLPIAVQTEDKWKTEKTCTWAAVLLLFSNKSGLSQPSESLVLATKPRNLYIAIWVYKDFCKTHLFLLETSCFILF